MAPAKPPRNNHDDHKPDAAPPKEKHAGHASTKMRRAASQQTAAPQHRDPPRPPPILAPAQVPAADEALPPTLPWPSFERRALHAYLREHDLSTPTSRSSSFHHWVLSRPGGIGLHSPTMVRKQQAQRQSKDHLALAVRKHFNGLGIQENDVIVDFIYKVRNDKAMKHEGSIQDIGLVD